MTTLNQERCVACRKDSPQVTPQEIAQFLPLIPDWQLIEVEGVKHLSRTFKFKDFKTALAFTNAVGDAAEAEGHHPKLVTEWGRVDTSIEWTFRRPTAVAVDSQNRILVIESISGRIQFYQKDDSYVDPQFNL